MIIALAPDSYFRHRYLLCLAAPTEKAAFLRRAKVKPGTYAGDLIANLHDAIFYRSLELKADYKKYYAVEYDTFADYVRKRFLLPSDVVVSVCSQLSRSSQIIFFHPIYSFIEDSYGRGFLERLLEPGRQT
jgi:hypothetical protein